MPTAPQPLAVGNGWTASYSTDSEFGRPRGAVFANARVGAVSDSPESYVLALLWRLACLDNLRERLWPARTAGLQYALDVGPRGVSLSFSGYSDGLAALARDVSQSAAKFVPDEASTARLADVIRRDLQDKSKPYVAAGFAATRALTRDGAFADQELVKALDAVFADVLRMAREPWTLGPPPDAVSRLTGPVGKMRRFFRAFAALHGVVGGHAEIYYDRRASEPYDVTLLLPRAELAVVAHWDAEDVAGAVAGLREVDVSGALARWQLLVDENSTGAYVVRDLDV